MAQELPAWGYGGLARLLDGLVAAVDANSERERVFSVLTLLLDRRVGTGSLKRSCITALVEECIARVAARVAERPGLAYACASFGALPSGPASPAQALVIEARAFPAEGRSSLARALVELRDRGFRHMLVVGACGHRFLASGLGPESQGVRIDVYGCAGDYLASGIDGASVVVHGSGQDQLGQIMKFGTFVVHGDVGQTFMYGAKGGDAFVLGSAAGRPLINAVGRPRVVINGTCLDYLAESFMAGDPLNGGGFVILNAVEFDEDGVLGDMPMPYPGGNLFSLASGGAIYLRDPLGRVGEDQLNGGAFAPLTPADWELMRALLVENERLFGIPVERLLTSNGERLPPERVYRKIAPSGHKALLPEEAWVRKES